MTFQLTPCRRLLALSHRFFLIVNNGFVSISIPSFSARSFYILASHTSKKQTKSIQLQLQLQQQHPRFINTPGQLYRTFQPTMAPIVSATVDSMSGDIGSQTEGTNVQVSKLLFVKLTEHASAPTKGSKFSAGYDLKSAYDIVIPKRGSELVKTDIQIQLPPGTYGRVAPRSGLALKNKIDVGAGVIDEDYRGNIGVILFNHGDEDFIIGKGDRIAQLICEKIENPEVIEVENLDVSDRGADGFGSTGVKRAKLDKEVERTVDATYTVTVLSPTKQPKGTSN